MRPSYAMRAFRFVFICRFNASFNGTLLLCSALSRDVPFIVDDSHRLGMPMLRRASGKEPISSGEKKKKISTLISIHNKIKEHINRIDAIKRVIMSMPNKTENFCAAQRN